MEKKCICLLLCLLSIKASAQYEAEHFMLEDGKTWNYDYHQIESVGGGHYTEIVFPVSYTILGDTVMDGRSYKKMYREGQNQRCFYAGYREEGLKVFVRFPDIEEELTVVYFEYNGEELNPYFKVKERIDSIEVNGILYRRHIYTYYVNNQGERQYIGVEGIGYLNGLNSPAMYELDLDCYCDYETFTSCEMNGTTIFRFKDFYAPAYHAIPEHLQTVGIEGLPHREVFYDINGHRLATPPTKGIYIQDRKKVTGK